jgi:energy-coupling factor transporter ATP-binding protein EcfA2
MNAKGKVFIATWIGIIATLLLTLGAYSAKGRLRMVLGLIAGVCPLPTLALSHRLDRLEDEAVDHAVNYQVQRQLTPYKTTTQTQTVTALSPVPAYDWERMITDRDNNPFVMFMGVQGAGKTTLAAMLQSYGKARKVVVNKHVNFSQFPHADHQIEPGRDYDRLFVTGEEDVTLRLSDLCIQGQPIIECSFLQVLYSFIAEFNYRFSNRLTDLEPWDIWVDEVPSLYSDLADKGFEELWKKFLKISMMEARKYKLRVFFIVQSKTVDSIGMKGLAALRDESITVSLGDSAVSKGKTLKLDEGVMDILKTPYKACIINDEPVMLPDIGAIAKAKDDAEKEALKARIAELEGQGTAMVLQSPHLSPVDAVHRYAPAVIVRPVNLDPKRLEALKVYRTENPDQPKTQVLRAVGLPTAGRSYVESKAYWEASGS